LAITYNSLEIVELLLENKVIDVNSLGKNKENGLMLCVNVCNLEIFEILLRDKRIDIMQCDLDGNSVFHVALDVGAISIIQIFLEYLERLQDKTLQRKFVNI